MLRDAMNIRYFKQVVDDINSREDHERHNLNCDEDGETMACEPCEVHPMRGRCAESREDVGDALTGFMGDLVWGRR